MRDWVRGLRDSGRLGMPWMMDEDVLKPRSLARLPNSQTASYQSASYLRASLP